MADVVQYRLEQQIQELEQLEKNGIFTTPELKQIMKKRRNLEYRLKRPSPLKQDFLAYIEYEKQLDALRRLRKKSVSRELEEMGAKKLKKSASDHGGITRILRVFHLATTKFKGDIDIWFRYLEFCKEHGHGRMKKVLAQVLRFHPKIPEIWLYAAAWEFDHNLNAAGARPLMQTGLRACPHSEDMWVEYLRMELTYLNKLKTRKTLLGENSASLTLDHKTNDEKQWKDENQDLFMPLHEQGTHGDGSDVNQEDSENKLDLFQEQASGIFQVIYNEAVEALPASMNMRKRFLEIYDDLDLVHLDHFREELINGMRKDFAKHPEYWDWLARLQISDPRKGKNMNKGDLQAQLDKAVGIYEESLKIVPSAKMFSLYTKFWMDVISTDGDSQNLGITHYADFSLDFISDLLKVYEKAESMGCMLEDNACQYVSLYLQLGRLEEARELAEKLCRGKLSGVIKLWELRVSMEIKWITSKSPSLSKDDLNSIFKLVQDILVKLSISEAGNLWHMAIKFFSNDREYFDKLVQTFISLIPRCSEGGFSVSSVIVNFTYQRDGIQRAREIYKRFLALPRPSLALHRDCIELESNLAFVGEKDGLLYARKVYESAVRTYSQDLDLWRDFYSLEKKVGTSETANAVYWRARKILGDNTAGLLILPQDL